MKILLAVDGSECGLRAARFLVRLLDGREAQVEVVNVQPTAPYGELLSAETRGRIEALKEERGRLAAMGVMDLVGFAHLPCRLHVVSGDPAPAIAALARDLGCELIVMGSRGLGSIAGMALGSVATRVLHLAEVPVTVVK